MKSSPIGGSGKTLIRVRLGQPPETLGTYTNDVDGNRTEVSDDGDRVLVVNPDNLQLEDIGNVGSPELISLLPSPGAPVGVPQTGGTQSSCGLQTQGESFAGAGAGLAASRHWQRGYRMIDVTDASRVYFQVPPNEPECDGEYALYVRNRASDPPTTTLIDPGTVEKAEEPQFIRAEHRRSQRLLCDRESPGFG